jgi:ubiquinol-cytochrome c reductase cytochrome b subunit
MATNFHMSINHILTFLQIGLFVLPGAAFYVTRRICRGLQLKDRDILLHGRESGRIVRLPHGEYVEVHEPVDEFEAWKRGSYEVYKPGMPRPDSRGRITVSARVRAALSRFYFSDSVIPPTQEELDRARKELGTPVADAGTSTQGIGEGSEPSSQRSIE